MGVERGVVVAAEVRRRARGSSTIAVQLDSGAGIDPRSLRRRDSRVTWRNVADVGAVASGDSPGSVRGRRGALEPLEEALDRLWLAEEVALAVVDAELAQQRDGRLVADVLGDRLLTQPARDRDDGLDHELVGARAAGVAHELAVDLQDVEVHVLEVVEGAEAGAEVVQREAAAELRQLVRELARRGDVS